MLDEVDCTGTETTLYACDTGSIFCGHNQDAGVKCLSSKLAVHTQ